MTIQLKPRSNGDTDKPKWVEDDELDQLAEQLPPPLPVDDDIPTLPPMPAPARSQLQDRVAPKTKPVQPDVDAKIREVALKLVDLMTDTEVRCWVQDGSFVATKTFERDSKTFQQTTSIRFAGVSVKTVELIS